MFAEVLGSGNNMVNFEGFVSWAFLGLVGGGVAILWQMKEGLNSLNTKIAVLIEQHDKARKDIDDHEDRIRELEHNK